MEWLDMNVTDPQTQFTGFDMDLMRAIGQKLNVTPVFTTYSFDAIIPDIQAHKYDLSISSFSITGERQGMVLFSKPYFQVQQTIVIRANDNSISNATDLVDKGKVVATQRGTTGAATAANLTGSDGKKIDASKIRQFDTAEEAYQDLKKGTSDAVINDIEVNAYEVKMYPGDYKFTGEKFPTLEPYGIVIAKDNPQLKSAIDWALDQLQADGTIDQLKQKYDIS
jgi:ABC-type amino acid transport substrate-binding protein